MSDLLQFVHDPTAAIGGSLLDGETVTMPIDPSFALWGPVTELAVVRSLTDVLPRPLVVVNEDGQIIGTIRSAEHRHLAVLADAGFQLLASPTSQANGYVTEITVRADLE